MSEAEFLLLIFRIFSGAYPDLHLVPISLDKVRGWRV